jgi:predicted ATPase
VQGLPPETEYRFKHALIQDAAYENLLKSRRQVLHRRIAEILRDRFADRAAAEPEVLAHHFTQAGLTDAAIEWWGKAGQRSVERSALVEAISQLTRALDQIATLPGTPALRREQIKLQVTLINPLISVKGYAASATTAAVERAQLLIEQAEALGEPPEDPLLLFSVLYGVWAANYVAFNGDVMHRLAAQFLSLAEKQKATFPLMTGHRLMGISLMVTGDIAEGRSHLDRAVALYDLAEHRSLATRFGTDALAHALCWRSWALWLLGYPEAALADTDRALKRARGTGHAATLLVALTLTSFTHILSGNYATANAAADEAVALAGEKGATLWKAIGMLNQSCVVATGEAVDAVRAIASAITAWRSTGATMWMPLYLPFLAMAYADLGQFDEAWRCVEEATTAVETTGERWCEAEVSRVAGEIALLSHEPEKAKAEGYFDRGLGIARKQQAKSFELRASMSLARLSRSQGKMQQARELLAPVYGWFTEGFDTRDLKEAKALLEELAT